MDDRTNVTFEEIVTFFEQNPTWPNQVALKQKAERAIKPNTDADVLRRWFRKNPPVTAEGAVSFSKVDRTDQDHQILQDSFTKVVFKKEELKTFIENTTDVIKAEHIIKRFDGMLEKENVDQAELLFPYVPTSYKVIAQDRVKLARGYAPKRLSKTEAAGYLWQYANALRKANQDDELVKFLNEKAVQKAEDVYPERFWNERKVLIRRLIEKKEYKTAYTVAANVKLTKGPDFAEAKWYQGWINLRFLKRPKEAIRDFEQVYEKADTALYLSKAAYWAGRAAENMNDKATRVKWLKKASGHLGTFYGQLAHSMLGEAFSKDDYVISKKENKEFEDIELVKAIRLLKKIDNIDLSELFFWKLAINVTRPDEHELLIKLAAEVAGAYAAVQVTKIGAKSSIPILDDAYPHIERAMMPPLAEDDGVSFQALVHAIIRQESRFKSSATSPKGARGLMQILDGTAKQISRSEGIRYSSLYDTRSNIILGDAYIRSLLRKYNGSLILAIAAYNAGPSVVNRWVKEFGCPNDREGFEAVEWISRIPYRETRHYVERVLENYWRYWVSFKGISLKQWHKLLY